jgi:pimeloyl-ACP methyl ester carboxylesterase
MTDFAAATIITSEAWVTHPRGRIFARTWASPDSAIRAGEQAPIVLFHDSLGCVDLWRDFPARLGAATGRKIIAYDRLGFGRSDSRTDKLAVDFIADEATTYFPAIREQLGIGEFIGFGHSVGGGMAANCAAMFPTECVALLTESAQAFLEDRTVQGIRAAKQQFQDAQQIARLEKYHGEKAKWVLDAWTETWLAPAFASWSLADVLPKVMCPALAMHGEFDEYGSTKHPELIRQWCSGSTQVEIMADIYHVPHRERPDDTITLIANFLSAMK